MLGAIPTSKFLVLWGLFILVMMAVAFATAALQTVLGAAGTLLVVIVFVIFGAPASGGAVPAAYLPGFWRTFGPYLPAGAGTTAVRNTIYFDGNAITTSLLVLAGYLVVGARRRDRHPPAARRRAAPRPRSRCPRRRLRSYKTDSPRVGAVGDELNLLWSSVILVGADAVAISAMLLVRRRVPVGSFFSDGDRSSGVFGGLARRVRDLRGVRHLPRVHELRRFAARLGGRGAGSGAAVRYGTVPARDRPRPSFRPARLLRALGRAPGVAAYGGRE